MRAFQFLLSVPAVLRQLISNHFVEVFLGNDGHAQLEGFVPLGASSAACQEEGCGFGDGPGSFSSVGGDKLFKVVPRMAERSRNDEGFPDRDPAGISRKLAR